MSEFFLELFSEEIPAKLQQNVRDTILDNFRKLFLERELTFKKNLSYSTPNRLVVLFDGLPKEINQKEQEIRGPNINAPESAIEGFLRSNKISKNQIFTKKIEKGEFYFFKKLANKIKTQELLNEDLPKILDKIKWKKSMKWGNFDLEWARPLKSILAIFDGKNLNFKFHHLEASNFTYVDKDFENKKKIFKSYKDYQKYFTEKQIIIDHNLRKQFIKREFEKISKKKNIIVEINNKLLDEVTDLVEKPTILLCKFDQNFLKMPKEILIITMEYHQKYFHTIDKKGNITNEFLVVANNKDKKGLIKLGNERVVEARLSDAQFFWDKDKSQNLVKQIGKLKNINYFKGLGNYFDKVQRIRKIGAMVSDELLISKDKVELSASICKVDLISGLVGEFPELQGVMGSYFAEVQGFEKDIVQAINEHYLPIGLESKVPKKLFSIALALTDKLDTLVGFFGIDQKPTSSKDPFALRRSALGIIRILIENNKEIKIKDLINYSITLYEQQGYKFKNEFIRKELIEFLMDRLKFYMKEKGIKSDIIDAGISSFTIDHLNKIYNKSFYLNKVLSKETGENIISSYKRASNILEHEFKVNNLSLSGNVDPGLFINEYEKNLLKKIQELRKYFTGINKDEKYEVSLFNLAASKEVIFEFFDKVVVNDEDKKIQKNRLELLQMLCRTFENYINFSNIESI